MFYIKAVDFCTLIIMKQKIYDKEKLKINFKIINILIKVERTFIKPA